MEVKSLNYTVLIEQDEDGIYIAKVPDIPDCYTQGKTVEQAMERMRKAIQVWLEIEGFWIIPPLWFFYAIYKNVGTWKETYTFFQFIMEKPRFSAENNPWRS